MNATETSVFRIYAIGNAAENLEFGETELEVWPGEKFPTLDGDVTANQENISAEGENAEGQKYTQNINTGNVIRAKWLSRDTNRPFPSLIRRGELVILWRNADSDQFYWEEMGTDIRYRRGDIWTLACISTVVQGEDPISPLNAYWFEIDSLNGVVRLSTTKLNGEATAYEMEFMTREGTFRIEDDIGNFIKLESNDQRWTIANASESTMVMDAENVTLSMNGKYTVNAQEMEVNIQNGISINAQTKEENITTSYTLQTITASMTATANYNISSAAISLGGPITGGGYGGGAGSATFNGTMHVSEAVTSDSTIESAGDITAAGLNLNTHKHKDSRNGDCSTPIP